MNCPTCGSPDPGLHPATQHGGEVEICVDDFHLRDTPSAKPYHGAVWEKRWRLHFFEELEKLKADAQQMSARIVELEAENNLLNKTRPARSTLLFTGNQAETLLRAFGGEPCTYVVGEYQSHEVAPLDDGSPAPAGLYASSLEYPEEGVIYLGEENSDYQPMWVREGVTLADVLAQWPVTKPLPERAALNIDVLCQELTHYVTQVPIKDADAEAYFRQALVTILPALDKVPYDLVRVGAIRSVGNGEAQVTLQNTHFVGEWKDMVLFAARRCDPENADG